MSLSDTMNQIKKIKVVAETEVLEQPRETLGGRLSRQTRAKEDLKGLTEKYRQELLRSAVFILVSGSGNKEFVKIATDALGFFQANANQVYSDIAGQVSPQLYAGKESNPGLMDVVSRVLENKALEIGVTGYPMIKFRQEFRRKISDRTDFEALLKQILNAQVGTELVGAQAVKSILTDAIEAEHSGKTTPILLAVGEDDSDLSEGLRRISSNVASVYIDSSAVNNESVLKTMLELKTMMSLGRNASLEIKGQDLIPELLEAAAIKSAENMGAAESLTIPLDLKDGETEDQALERTLTDLNTALMETKTETKTLTAKERKALERQNKNKN